MCIRDRHIDILVFDNVSNSADVTFWDDPAGRVRWIVEDDEFCPVCDGILKGFDVKAELFFFQKRHINRFPAGKFYNGLIDGETGIGADDLVVRLNKKKHGVKHNGLAARYNNNFFFVGHHIFVF